MSRAVQSKAARIRAYAAKHAAARPIAIVKALAKKGVVVTSAQVCTTLSRVRQGQKTKAQPAGKRKARKTAAKKRSTVSASVTGSAKISPQAIIAAAALLQASPSMRQAKSALAETPRLLRAIRRLCKAIHDKELAAALLDAF